MNWIDIVMIVVILLSTILGFKTGVLKTTVRLVGVVVCAIVAYSLKGILAGFLIDFMPFFNFAGIFEDIQGINILFYHAVSFIFIFILLYCIINILINIAGILDKIMKATIILALPNKILGALVGFIEGLMIVFIAIFTLYQLPQTGQYINESSYASIILNRTPIIRTALAETTVITEEIYDAINEYEETDDKDKFHTTVIRIFINKGLATAEKVDELIKDEKIILPDVTFYGGE